MWAWGSHPPVRAILGVVRWGPSPSHAPSLPWPDNQRMEPGSKSEAVFAMTVSLAWRDCDPLASHRPAYKQDGDDLETWEATSRQHESGQDCKNSGTHRGFEPRGRPGPSKLALNQAFWSRNSWTCAMTASFAPSALPSLCCYWPPTCDPWCYVDTLWTGLTPAGSSPNDRCRYDSNSRADQRGPLSWRPANVCCWNLLRFEGPHQLLVLLAGRQGAPIGQMRAGGEPAALARPESREHRLSKTR